MVPQERDAKKSAEQEAEARSADARGLERRLKAAVEAAALAEHSAAKCIEVSADPSHTTRTGAFGSAVPFVGIGRAWVSSAMAK